jgi:hypothetical protein
MGHSRLERVRRGFRLLPSPSRGHEKRIIPEPEAQVGILGSNLNLSQKNEEKSCPTTIPVPNLASPTGTPA